MANVCDNWVEISGDDEEVKKCIQLVGEKFDFNKVIPLGGKDDRKKAVENWGCSSIAFDTNFEKEDLDRASWQFWTKWNPPTEIYKKLVEMFPKLFIYWRYEEPGNGLYGYLNNGQGGF